MAKLIQKPGKKSETKKPAITTKKTRMDRSLLLMILMSLVTIAPMTKTARAAPNVIRATEPSWSS